MTSLAKKHRTGEASERRCIVTGESAPKPGLIRFVLGPSGDIVPDLGERLPGRGVWVTATKDAVVEAATKGRFSRALKGPVGIPESLAETVEALLVSRCQDTIGLARRSDRLVVGYDRVLDALARDQVGVVAIATDAGGAKRDVAAAAGDMPVAQAMTNDELSTATGKGTVSFLAILRGGLAETFRRENDRLLGFRPEVDPAHETDVNT